MFDQAVDAKVRFDLSTPYCIQFSRNDEFKCSLGKAPHSR
jgi:hypothetical protein